MGTYSESLGSIDSDDDDDDDDDDEEEDSMYEPSEEENMESDQEESEISVIDTSTRPKRIRKNTKQRGKKWYEHIGSNNMHIYIIYLIHKS